MVKNFGYILPYRTRNGKLEVLVGKKQVLSFEAIAKQSIDDAWVNIDFANPINDKGYVKTTRGRINTRFNGMLLPGGGKPCFFGGSSQGSESHELAAQREFREELNLTIGANAWNNRLEPVLDTNWGGRYFAVDVDRLLPQFDWNKHLVSIKVWSAEWEQLPLQQVKTRQESRYPELREAVWLEAQEALRLLESVPDQARMRSEVKRFASYIIETTRVNIGESVRTRFEEALVNYMVQQDVGDNVVALRTLLVNRH